MKKPKFIVDNWLHLWKSLVMWSAGVGLVLPEILQLIADQTQAMTGLDADTKNWIRIVCLALVIVFRPIKQPSVSNPPKE
jgi:hypothetical protein